MESSINVDGRVYGCDKRCCWIVKQNSTLAEANYITPQGCIFSGGIGFSPEGINCGECNPCHAFNCRFVNKLENP